MYVGAFLGDRELILQTVRFEMPPFVIQLLTQHQQSLTTPTIHKVYHPAVILTIPEFMLHEEPLLLVV